MGWLQLARTPVPHALQNLKDGSDHPKVVPEHIEDVGRHRLTVQKPANAEPLQRKYPFRPEATPDHAFPLIPREEVRSKRRPQALAARASELGQPHEDYWIVIDDMVYDCSKFIEEHPGGEQVILSFLGEDCSWQFWRFHSRAQQEQYGRALRIGRTEGVENRFKEPNRFVGLSKLGDDDW